MKTYFKTVLRSFKNNIGRFVAIFVIILLGVAFVSGLGTLSPKIKDSFSSYLSQHNTADLIVKSTEETGFTHEQISDIQSCELVENVLPFTVFDVPIKINGYTTRIYIIDLDSDINKLDIMAGNLPTSKNQVVVERASDTVVSYDVGDNIAISYPIFNININLDIVGVVANPLYFAKDGDTLLENQNKYVEQIIYIRPDGVDFSTLPIQLPTATDMYVTVENTQSYGMYSDKYKEVVTTCKDNINKINSDCFTLTLSENKSYAMLEYYCDKVAVISLIFPIFFIAVAALVVLTTMSRLIEEERTMIGCYMTLGVNNGRVIFKYLFISLVIAFVASLVGIVLGTFLLPHVIFPAFDILFHIPAMSTNTYILTGIIAAIFMMLAVGLVTLYVVKRELKGQPADTLRPKAPKSGKKIFLEKIPFIWKGLSFRMKSTFRNIFRYVNHLVMTVVSVAGSTALVLAGFALFDISKAPTDNGVSGYAELLSPIALVVVVFAVLLCAFVVYNLTNMNIGERKREMATLKVLGYHEREVCSYIYKEIFIMAIFGVLVGIPLGVGLIAFIFYYLEFGLLSDIRWFSYIFSGVVVLLFVGVVDLLMIPKIRKIDMTTSLKSNE